jgi:hypothetical protein
MLQTKLLPRNLSRIHIAATKSDGTPVDVHLINTGNGTFVERDEMEPKLEEVTCEPALVLEPVSIADFVNLIIAARNAARALDHFVQLHDPTGVDLHAKEKLAAALAPFFPAPEQP